MVGCDAGRLGSGRAPDKIPMRNVVMTSRAHQAQSQHSRSKTPHSRKPDIDMQPMSLSSAARFATGAAMAQLQDADLMVTARQAMAHPSCTARSVFQCKACPRRVFGPPAQEALAASEPPCTTGGCPLEHQNEEWQQTLQMQYHLTCIALRRRQTRTNRCRRPYSKLVGRWRFFTQEQAAESSAAKGFR